MSVTLEAQITVETGDLRDAFRAVVPHAEQLKTGDLEQLHRIRLVFDKHDLYVLATNGFTSALAIVSIEEDSRRERFAPDDGPIVVDLTPRQCRLALQQFKAKATDPDGVVQRLTFGLGKAEVRLTDVSGLFAGESIVFPEVGVADGFPDVLGVLTRTVAGVGTSPLGKPLVTDGKTLTLFRQASESYGQPLAFEGTGTPESRGFVVSCGESFLGLVSSRFQDDDSLKKRDAWRRAWLRRLGLEQAAPLAV